MDDHSRAGVRETYERIGDHFSKTREYAWPEVASFLETVDTAGTALDIGCGNGRHTDPLTEIAERAIGIDASRALLREARKRVGPEPSFILGDATRLPLAATQVDLAVYVATLHHLPTDSARKQSLDELARVLTQDGRALVSAWSTAHDRFDATAEDATGFDTTIDWTLPGGETVPRYYHIYAPDEFKREIDSTGLVLRSFEISSGNCYAVVESE
jgi:ubiquinone/menaquinone biosynthesis C-methylase UbiE